MAINLFNGKGMKVKAIALLVIAIVFSSCSFQKRLYNKGFYVSKSHSTENLKVAKDSSLLAKLSTPKKIKNQPLTASTKSKSLDFFVSTNKWLVDGCDTIYLKSGGRILAHITEVNLTKVLFKKCGEDDDKILFVKKDEVAGLSYFKGSSENYNNNNNTGLTPEPTDKNQPQNLPGQQQNFNNGNSIPDFYGNPNQNSYQQNAHSHNYNQPTQKRRKVSPFALIGFIISSAATLFMLLLTALLAMASISNGQNYIGQLYGGAHFYPFLAVPLVLVAAGVILCIIAIIQINTKGQDKYKGLKLAYIGLGFCLLLLLLLGLIIF